MYRHAAFRHHARAGGYAFLSKAPLRERKYVPPRHGPFGLWTARTRLAGRDVQVAAVHLCPVVPRRGETLMRTFLRTEAVRAKEIAWLHEHLSAKLPVILLGDFNSPSTLTAGTFLARRGFVDSFASVTPDPDRHVTWHWRYQDVNWRFRIDYIFHPAALKTIRSRILRSEASDHYLLVSTLEWAPPRPTTAPADADD